MIRIGSVLMKECDVSREPSWVMMTLVTENGRSRLAFFRLAEDQRTWDRYSPSSGLRPE